jgi:hypothetical protein
LQQEHPLPTGQPALTRSKVAEDPAREWPADQAGNRNGRHEQRHDPATTERREPLREVQHNAGEEPGFGGTGEQAQGIELGRCGDKHQAGRQDAPSHHHHRDPAPRAEPGQCQIAGYATQHVTNEENPGTQAVHSFAELQRVEHL